jgi:hypothetical protein
MVNGFHGGQVNLIVERNETVDHLKQMIEQRTGIRERDQTLNYGGRSVVGGGTIDLYNSRNGMTFQLMKGTHGGRGKNKRN